MKNYMRHYGTVEQRFWAKVDKSKECWEWLASFRTTGYGQFGMNGVPTTASRVAWILTNGEIPKGMVICHRCDNRKCVRPDHLFLGTMKDNSRDMVAKGRHRAPKQFGAGEKNFKAKINFEIAERIRADRKLLSWSKLSKKYGLVVSSLYDIVKNKRWIRQEEEEPVK